MSECPKCKGTGLADSGGVQPWGEPIFIECDCKIEESIMEESRIQFQKWWVTYSDKCKHPCDDVEYFAAKEAWQASRAAIEINLPPAMGDHQIQWDGTDWNMMREHAVKSIRAAGLKIKGE